MRWNGVNAKTSHFWTHGRVTVLGACCHMYPPWSDQLDCLVLVECFAEVMLMTSSFWAHQNFNVMAVLVAIVPRTVNFAASSNSSRCTRQPPLVSSLWPAVPIASMSDSESKATNVMGTRAKRFDVKVNETEKSRFSAKASIWSLGTQQELWWGPSYSPHHSCWSDQFKGISHMVVYPH